MLMTKKVVSMEKRWFSFVNRSLFSKIYAIEISFEEIKTKSYCVGGRHRSSITNIFGGRTSKSDKVFLARVHYVIEKKSLTVSHNIVAAESLGDFFKSIGQKDSMHQERCRIMF